jgi:hypothetical protein
VTPDETCEARSPITRYGQANGTSEFLPDQRLVASVAGCVSCVRETAIAVDGPASGPWERWPSPRMDENGTSEGGSFFAAADVSQEWLTAPWPLPDHLIEITRSIGRSAEERPTEFITWPSSTINRSSPSSQYATVSLLIHQASGPCPPCGLVSLFITEQQHRLIASQTAAAPNHARVVTLSPGQFTSRPGKLKSRRRA